MTIALIAKGSVDNLHRPAVVEAFRAQGVAVQFLVREGAAPLGTRLAGCRYLACRFPEERGRLAYWRGFCRYLRSLYKNRRIGLLTGAEKRGARRRLTYGLFRALARSRRLMRLVLAAESRLYRDVRVEGLDPGALEQLLLQSIGGRDSEHEAILTWWARRHGISVVHMLGNYDHLSSKGYRGAPVDHLLVWGPVMREDAVALHGLAPDRIRTTGALRYDGIARMVVQDRAAFLAGVGLDPAKRTILFAGSQYEYHYFEMLEAFETLRARADTYQLVLRIYPDRALMASPYVRPLIGYARSRPGVYVSIGDPRHGLAGPPEPLPEIEQAELWHALAHSDVVVNIYSTIALEACLLDTPAIYVWYHQTRGHGWLRPPAYFEYGELLHNRRMVDYGAIPVARDREALLRLIPEVVADPARHKARRAHVVRQELGPLDGGAAGRLAAACVEAFVTDRGGVPPRAVSPAAPPRPPSPPA